MTPKLSANDAAILTRVLQYQSVPAEQRRILLSGASPDAQKIGNFILDPDNAEDRSPWVKAAAASLQQWIESNRRVGRIRRLARKTARAR